MTRRSAWPDLDKNGGVTPHPPCPVCGGQVHRQVFEKFHKWAERTTCSTACRYALASYTRRTNEHGAEYFCPFCGKPRDPSKPTCGELECKGSLRRTATRREQFDVFAELGECFANNVPDDLDRHGRAPLAQHGIVYRSVMGAW